MKIMKHKSVLLEEVIDNLRIKQNGIYIDATVGYAGHSGEILKKLNKKGFLFAFDQDIEAIEYSNKKLSKISNNYKIIKSNFLYINDYVDKKVNGILFDLGVSSPQLDEDERGFSFHKDAKLDMRMDKDNSLSAYEVVNDYSYERLVKVLYEYGEEKYSKQIVKNIIKNRPISNTLELAEIIKSSVPIKYRNMTHPARKTFQAIRIEVNHELDILSSSLKKAFDLLDINGIMCVITFHSLEDKIVSKVFNELCSDEKGTSKLPIVPEELMAKAKKIAKIVPSEEEIIENNRCRSAKLRVIERIR